MSEEGQERFEDYLEMEQYIEQLRLNESARPPANLTPQQMRIYRMAMLFHSASPHVADPRPEFAAQLQQRLLEQVQTSRAAAAEREDVPVPQPTETMELQETRLSSKSLDATQTERHADPQVALRENAEGKQHTTREGKKGKSPFSRRTLLTGGTAAAASLLAGAGIDHTLTAQQKDNSPVYQYPPLVGNIPTTWHLVTSVGQLGQEAIQFTTDIVTGYVIRQVENGNGTRSHPTEQIIAFSAACTHMGCIVQWQENKRQFLCPCHGGVFDSQGKPGYTSDSQIYFTALPRLETKIENGNIYVKVPLPPRQA